MNREGLKKKISLLEQGMLATETPLARHQLQEKLDAARKQLRDMDEDLSKQSTLF